MMTASLLPLAVSWTTCSSASGGRWAAMARASALRSAYRPRPPSPPGNGAHGPADQGAGRGPVGGGADESARRRAEAGTTEEPLSVLDID